LAIFKQNYDAVNETIAFVYLILVIWFTCSKNILNYLSFQPFNFGRTWSRLFQKRVVRT